MFVIPNYNHYFSQIRSQVSDRNPPEPSGSVSFESATSAFQCQVILTYNDAKVILKNSSAECFAFSSASLASARKKRQLTEFSRRPAETTKIPSELTKPPTEVTKTSAGVTKPTRETIKSTAELTKLTTEPTKPQLTSVRPSKEEKVCKKSVFARTGFVFQICLLVKIFIGNLGVSGIESASIISAKIVRKSVSINEIDKVVNLTKFENITDSVDANAQLLENVVISVVNFLEHESAAEEQRFKRRWVQSNTFTDRLARDKRLFSFVELAVQESLSPSVARVKRQISNSEVLDEVITFDQC